MGSAVVAVAALATAAILAHSGNLKTNRKHDMVMHSWLKLFFTDEELIAATKYIEEVPEDESMTSEALPLVTPFSKEEQLKSLIVLAAVFGRIGLA